MINGNILDIPILKKQLKNSFFVLSIIRFALFFCLFASFPSLVFCQEVNSEDQTDDFKVMVNDLAVKGFKNKEQLIHSLFKTNDPRLVEVFQFMLAGSLYYRKKDKRVVSVIKTDGEYQITDFFSNEILGTVSKRKIKRISVNNRLRSLLRNSIARLNLSNTDVNIRLSAVKDLMDNFSLSDKKFLQHAQSAEQSIKVREAMQVLIYLAEIDSNNEATKLTAIHALSGNLNAEVRARIASVLDKNDDGDYIEANSKIRDAADSAMEKINSKIKFYAFIENVFFGISLGSVLLLIAIGLAITFGVMGVINMAHGELMMLGAYTTYVVQLLMPNYIDYSLFVAIPAAFIVAGIFGIAIERGVIRYLYGRPLETLLATFGISLILQQLVRSIFTPLNRAVETPSWMSGSLEINAALSFTNNRLYIIAFSLIVFIVLMFILKKTTLGLQVRAVSQNRPMAKAMGIRTEWVDALTFGLGSGVAGVAGVALSQLTNVGPNLGQTFIIDSFLVVVFGGVGNLWGTLVGGLTLGLANKFIEPWVGAVLAKIFILIFIILFIQKRPRGLFPSKGRAADNE